MYSNLLKVCTKEWQAKHGTEPLGENFWSFFIHIGTVKHIYTFNLNFREAKHMASLMAGVHKAEAVTLRP